MERTNAWLGYTQEQLGELERINNLYKCCLDEGKTERECVKAAVRIAEEKGYRDLKDVIEKGEALRAAGTWDMRGRSRSI